MVGFILIIDPFQQYNGATRRTVLRLSDLDNAKSAVLNSLTSSASRRVYEHAVEEFIAWYCSVPRLAFNRIVVVRYRIHLEARNLAAATINQRLAAVRRLALEAADSGPLSSELAAGIQRVKGAKQIGHRSGNWLTLEQGANLLNCAFGDGLRTKRLCHAGDVTRLQSSPVRVGRVGNRKDSNAAGTLGDC